MSGSTETQWREALAGRGPAWVKAKLWERPGRADDIVHDIVFQDPYPTRAFCEKWCAEQDNRIIHLSGHSKVTFIAAMLLLVFVVKAVVSWNHLAPPKTPHFAASRGVGTGGAAATTSPFDPVQASATVVTRPNTQSLCSYITYQTDRCGRSGAATGALSAAGASSASGASSAATALSAASASSATSPSLATRQLPTTRPSSAPR